MSKALNKCKDNGVSQNKNYQKITRNFKRYLGFEKTYNENKNFTSVSIIDSI